MWKLAEKSIYREATSQGLFFNHEKPNYSVLPYSADTESQ